MTETFERSRTDQPGTEDDTAQARQAKEAEHEHHVRLAAVRVVAGLASGAAEAREIYGMLGLSEAELRAARRPVVTVPGAAVAAAPAPRRKVSAA